ncbi:MULTISPECIES: acyl-CoA thioesterase [Nocardiopsis]|uniref:Thioesterase superfamily protein n=1 Tax=Nocardiopsis dassonvillei (strain ATCC 23218 / DSM 43111 / CIP 107115 / JCM 7437 / KCTC 9190 / NBRC 14626 / NCTC 10488 / NRRL B-5397 / IMRU 509) TaxID=446468 RepID=D7B3R2_NOCDD|nr:MULTISPECIES: thioesterase family protein [Nocardiopsis]ADH68829.1 thioesterase superfamily protein [Nocardiopsis dassonvillei subsp. dassonvillei DSM 43111]APC36882.1 thioesterase [Nocardiopsis dassonvillei]NKY80231.1 acyl-CoA thioesterase [Nocardiopsis dassonvillei]VEI89338.1 Acyl-ACP thioesterase [Nocardiopsis dassonvillei]
MTQTETGAADTRTAEPRRHVHLAQVRYADLDPQHHVNNVRMLTYLEDARVSFLRYGGAVEGDEVFGAMVVARQEADYAAPLLPRSEPVRVELWVTEVRNASFTLAYEIRDETTVYLRARTVLVGFDVPTQRARRLNEVERAFLADYA